MGGLGHSAGTDGARFAARAGSDPAGARIVSLLATAALHVLAFATLISATGVKPGGGGERPRHLTVISLPPPPSQVEPPPLHPKVRSAAGAAPTTAPAPRLAVPIEALSEALPFAATSAPAKRAEVAAEPLPPPLPVAAPVEAGTTALREYQAIVWRHIAAHKPRGVQIKGTVSVKFQLGRDGEVLTLDVVQSSGNFNLDRIALRAIRQSGTFPQPPAALVSRQLNFIVPIDFR